MAREHFLAGVQDAVEVVVAPDLAGNRGPAVLAEAGVHAHLVAADRPVVVDGLVDGLARRVARRHLGAGGGTGQRVGVGGRLAVAGGLGQLGPAGLVHIVLGLGAAGRGAGSGRAGAGGGVAGLIRIALGRLGGSARGQDDLAVERGLHRLAGAVGHLHGELVEAHRVVAVGVVGEVLLLGAGSDKRAYGLGVQGIVGLISLQQRRRQAGNGLGIVGVHRTAQHLDGVAGQVLGRGCVKRALHAFGALDAVLGIGLHGFHAGHAGLDVAGRQAVEQVVAGHLDLLLGGGAAIAGHGFELVVVGQQVDAHAVQIGGVRDDGGQPIGIGRVVHGVDHLDLLGVGAVAHGLGLVGDLVLGHGVAVVAEGGVQHPLAVLVVPLLQDDALAGVALIGGGDVRRRIVGTVARALERLVRRLELVGRGGMVERAVVVGVVEHPSGDLLLHGHAQAGVVAGAVGAAGQVVGEHRMELGGLGALDLQRRAGGVQLGHRVGGEHGCRRGLAVAGVAAVAVGGRRLQLVVGIRVVRVQGLALVHRLRVGGLHAQKHRVLHGVGRIGGAAHEVAVGMNQIGIGEPCLGGLHVGVALQVLGGAPVAVPPVGVGHADAVAEHDALLRRPLGAVGHDVAVRVEGQPPLALQVVEDVGAVLGRDGVVGRLGRLGLLVALGEGSRAGGGNARGHHGAVGVVAGKANRRIGGVGRVGVLGRPGGIDRPAAGDHGGVLGVQRLGQSEGALQRQLDARHRVVGRSIALAHRKRAVHAVVVGVVEHHAGDLLGGRLNLAGIAAGHFLDRLAGDGIGDLHQLLGNLAGVGIFNLAQLLLGLVGEPVVGDVAVLRDEQIAFGRARTIDGLLHHIGDGDGHLGGLQVDGRRGLVDIAVLGVARALGQDDVAGVGAGAVVGGAVERDDGILGRDGDAVEHRLHVGVGVGIQLGPGQRVALHLLGQRLVEAREQPRLVVGQGGLVGARVVQLAHFHAVARQVVGAVLGGVGGRQVVEGVDALRGLVGHLLLADDVLGHRIKDVLHPAARIGRLGGDDARGVAGIVEHVPGARRARHQGVVEHRLAVAVDGLLAGGLVHDGLVLLLARQLVGAEGEVAHPEAGAVGGGLEGLGLDSGRGHAGCGGLGDQRALVGGIELALGGEGGQLGVHGEAEALVGGLALVGLDDAVALVDVQVRQRQVVPLGEVHHLIGQARLAVVLDAVVGALAGRGIACVLVGLVERVVPHLAGDRRAGHGKQARIPVVQTGRVAQVVDGVRRAEVHLAGAVVLLGLVLLLLLQVVAVVGLVLGVLVVELVVHRKRRVVVGQGLLVVALQLVVDRLVAGELEGVLALAQVLGRHVRTGRRGLVAVVVGAVQLKVLRVVAVVGGLVDEERLLLGAARDDDAFLVVGLGVHVGGHVVLRDGNELLVDVVVAEAERGVPLAQEVVPVGRPGLAGLLAGALALDRGRLGLVRHLDLVVELLLGVLRVASVGVLDVGVALGLVDVEVVVDAVEVGVVPRRRAQLVRRRRHGGLGVGLQHLAAVGHVGPQAVQGRLHRVGVGIAVHGDPAQGDELGVHVGEVAVGVMALLAVDLVVRGLDEVRPADARGGRVLVAAPNRVQVGDGAVDHQVHRVARKPRLQGLAALRVGVVGVVRLDVRVDQVVLGAEARKARARRLAHHGARGRGRKQPGGGEVRGEGDAAEREARALDGGLGGQVGHAGVITHGGGGRALAHDLDGAALVGLAVDELRGGKHRGLVQRQHRHELVQIALDLVADGVRLDVAFLAAGDDGVVRDGLHRAQVVARRHGHRLAGQQGVRPEGDDLVAVAVGALDSRAAEAAGGAGGADGIALGERIGDGDRLGLVRLVAVGGREGHVHRGLDVELLEGQKLVGRVRVVAVGHGHAGLVVARHGVHADGGEHDVGVLEGAGLHLAALLVQVVGERGGVLVVGAVDVLGAVEQLVVARDGGGVRIGHGTALDRDVHLLVAVHHLHVAGGLGVGRSRLVHAVGNLDVVLGRVLEGALAGVRLAQHGGGHGLGHGVGIRVDGLARRLAVLGEEGVAHGNGVVLVERVQVVLIDAQAVAGQTLGLVVVANAGALIARVDDVGGHVAEQIGARGGRIARVGLAQRLARVQLPGVLFRVLHDPLHDGGLVAVGVEDRLAERVRLPGRIAIGVCGLLVLHRGGDRRVVPGLHLHAHAAVLGALAHAGLVVLLDAVVVGILPDVVAQIALGAVDVAQGQLVLARIAHPLVAGIVVDGLELDGVGVVGLAVLVAVGLAVGGERELGRAAVGRVQRVAAVVQPDERQVGHERVGAGRAGHVAQVVVGHEHVGAVVVEAVALVGRRIVGPGVQRRLDEAVGHGLRGADDIGLARLQTEAEEAGLVGDHRGDVAVGIGGDVLDGAVLVLVDVHADALEALLVDLGGAGHLGLGAARAHGDGVEQRVDVLVVLRRAVGQDVVAVGDALEGDALGDAQLQRGHLLVVGLMHRIQGAVAHLGLVVGHRLHLEGSRGDHERRVHAVGMVGLDALDGEILVVLLHVQVRVTDGLRRRRVIVVLLREGEAQTVAHLLEARGGLQVGEDVVAGVAVVVGLGVADVRRTGVGVDVVAPGVEVLLARAGVADDPAVLEAGLGVVHELDDLAVAVDGVAVLVEELDLDVVDAGILHLGVVVEVLQAGGAVGVLRVVEGAANLLGHRGAVAHQALALLVDLQPVLVAVAALAVGNRLAGAHEGHGVVDDLAVLVGLHAADELAAVGRGLVGGAAVGAGLHVVFGRAGPVRIEPDVVAQVSALVGRVDEGARAHVLAEVHAGGVAGLGLVHAGDEGVPLQRGAQQVRLVQGLLAVLHDHAGIRGRDEVDLRVAGLGAEELRQVQRRRQVVHQAHVALVGHVHLRLGLSPDGAQAPGELVGLLGVGRQVVLQLGELDELVGRLHLVGGLGHLVGAVDGLVLAQAHVLEGLEAVVLLLGEVLELVEGEAVVVQIVLRGIGRAVDDLLAMAEQPQEVLLIGQLDGAGGGVALVGADPDGDVAAVDERAAVGRGVGVVGAELLHLDGIEVLQPARPLGVARAGGPVVVVHDVGVVLEGKHVVEHVVGVARRVGGRRARLRVHGGGIVAVARALGDGGRPVGVGGGQVLQLARGGLGGGHVGVAGELERLQLHHDHGLARLAVQVHVAGVGNQTARRTVVVGGGRRVGLEVARLVAVGRRRQQVLGKHVRGLLLDGHDELDDDALARSQDAAVGLAGRGGAGEAPVEHLAVVVRARINAGGLVLDAERGGLARGQRGLGELRRGGRLVVEHRLRLQVVVHIGHVVGPQRLLGIDVAVGLVAHLHRLVVPVEVLVLALVNAVRADAVLQILGHEQVVVVDVVQLGVVHVHGRAEALHVGQDLGDLRVGAVVLIVALEVQGGHLVVGEVRQDDAVAHHARGALVDGARAGGPLVARGAVAGEVALDELEREHRGLGRADEAGAAALALDVLRVVVARRGGDEVVHVHVGVGLVDRPSVLGRVLGALADGRRVHERRGEVHDGRGVRHGRGHLGRGVRVAVARGIEDHHLARGVLAVAPAHVQAQRIELVGLLLAGHLDRVPVGVLQVTGVVGHRVGIQAEAVGHGHLGRQRVVVYVGHGGAVHLAHGHGLHDPADLAHLVALVGTGQEAVVDDLVLLVGDGVSALLADLDPRLLVGRVVVGRSAEDLVDVVLAEPVVAVGVGAGQGEVLVVDVGRAVLLVVGVDRIGAVGGDHAGEHEQAQLLLHLGRVVGRLARDGDAGHGGAGRGIDDVAGGVQLHLAGVRHGLAVRARLGHHGRGLAVGIEVDGLAGQRVGGVVFGAGHLPDAGGHLLEGGLDAAHGVVGRFEGRVVHRHGVALRVGRGGGPEGHLPIDHEGVHGAAGVDGLGDVEVVGALQLDVLAGVDLHVGVVDEAAQFLGVGAHGGRRLADVEPAGGGGHVQVVDVLVAVVVGVRIRVVLGLLAGAEEAVDRLAVEGGADEGLGGLLELRLVGRGALIDATARAQLHVVAVLVLAEVAGVGVGQVVAVVDVVPRDIVRVVGEPVELRLVGRGVDVGRLALPGVDGRQLVFHRLQHAVGVQALVERRLGVAQVVQTGLHLQGHGVVVAQIAVAVGAGVVGVQQGVELGELAVGGVVGGGDLEHDHLALVVLALHRGVLAHALHIGAGAGEHIIDEAAVVHGVGGLVGVRLAVVGVALAAAIRQRAARRVGVVVVVGLIGYLHRPVAVEHLLGRQALDLEDALAGGLVGCGLGHRVALGVGDNLAGRIGLEKLVVFLVHDVLAGVDVGGGGVAVLVETLHVEGVVVAAFLVAVRIVLADPLVEVRVLLGDLQIVGEHPVVEEGDLAGQVQGEDELGMLQIALGLDDVGVLGRIQGIGVVQHGGREPRMLVVLPGVLLLAGEEQRVVLDPAVVHAELLQHLRIVLNVVVEVVLVVLARPGERAAVDAVAGERVGHRLPLRAIHRHRLAALGQLVAGLIDEVALLVGLVQKHVVVGGNRPVGGVQGAAVLVSVAVHVVDDHVSGRVQPHGQLAHLARGVVHEQRQGVGRGRELGVVVDVLHLARRAVSAVLHGHEAVGAGLPRHGRVGQTDLELDVSGDDEAHVGDGLVAPEQVVVVGVGHRGLGLVLHAGKLDGHVHLADALDGHRGVELVGLGLQVVAELVGAAHLLAQHDLLGLDGAVDEHRDALGAHEVVIDHVQRVEVLALAVEAAQIGRDCVGGGLLDRHLVAVEGLLHRLVVLVQNGLAVAVLLFHLERDELQVGAAALDEASQTLHRVGVLRARVHIALGDDGLRVDGVVLGVDAGLLVEHLGRGADVLVEVHAGDGHRHPAHLGDELGHLGRLLAAVALAVVAAGRTGAGALAAGAGALAVALVVAAGGRRDVVGVGHLGLDALEEVEVLGKLVLDQLAVLVHVAFHGVVVVVEEALVGRLQLRADEDGLAVHVLLHVDVLGGIRRVVGELRGRGDGHLLEALGSVVVAVEHRAHGALVGNGLKAVVEIAEGIFLLHFHRLALLHRDLGEGGAVAHVELAMVGDGHRERGGGAIERRVHLFADVAGLLGRQVGNLALLHVLLAQRRVRIIAQHVAGLQGAHRRRGVLVVHGVEGHAGGGLARGLVGGVGGERVVGHLAGALVVLGEHMGAAGVHIPRVQLRLGDVHFPGQQRQIEGLHERPVHRAVLVALQRHGDLVAVHDALGVVLHDAGGVLLHHLGDDVGLGVLGLSHLDELVAVGVAHDAVGHQVAVDHAAHGRGDDRAVGVHDRPLAGAGARGLGARLEVGGRLVGVVLARIGRTVERVGLHLVGHVERRHLGAQLHGGVHAGIAVGGRHARGAVHELLVVGGRAVGERSARVIGEQGLPYRTGAVVAMAVQGVRRRRRQAVGVGREGVVAHGEALALDGLGSKVVALVVLLQGVRAHKRQRRQADAAHGVGDAARARGLDVMAVEADEVVVGHLLGDSHARGGVAGADVLGRDEALGVRGHREQVPAVAPGGVGVVRALGGIEALVGVIPACGQIPAGKRVARDGRPVAVVGAVGEPRELLVARELRLGAHREGVLGAGVHDRDAGGAVRLVDAALVGGAVDGHVLVGEVLVAVHLRGDVGADVLVALGHGLRIEAHLGLVVGEHVELEGVQAAVDDLGHQVVRVVVAVGLGFEAQDVAVLLGAGVGGDGLEGVGRVPVGFLVGRGHVVVDGVQLGVAGRVVVGVLHVPVAVGIGHRGRRVGGDEQLAREIGGLIHGHGLVLGGHGLGGHLVERVGAGLRGGHSGRAVGGGHLLVLGGVACHRAVELRRRVVEQRIVLIDGGEGGVDGVEVLVEVMGGVAEVLVVVGIGAHHVGHVPVLGVHVPVDRVVLAVLAVDGVGLADLLGVEGHAVGQHDGHHGQREGALAPAVHRVVVARLGVVGLRGGVVVAAHVPLPDVGLLGEPVAVLHMHVHLAAIRLGVHVVGVVVGRHRIGSLPHLGHELGHGVPHAHEGLAHDGVGARLGVQGHAALQGVVVVHLVGVGHFQTQVLEGLLIFARGGDLVGHDRVVHHRVAIDGREVRGAVELAVKGRVHAEAAGRDERPAVVHAVGLDVLAAAAQGGVALVDVHVVDLVVGARVEGLLLRSGRSGLGGLLVEGQRRIGALGLGGQAVGAVLVRNVQRAGLGSRVGHGLVGGVRGSGAGNDGIESAVDVGLIVPRGGEQAVVPGLVLVVAEDVAGHVHAHLVAAGRVALGQGEGRRIGGGGCGRRAAEPLAEILLHGDFQHPGLARLGVGGAAHLGGIGHDAIAVHLVAGGVAGPLRLHGGVGGRLGMGGQIAGRRHDVALAVDGRILLGAGGIVAVVVAVGRLDDLDIDEIGGDGLVGLVHVGRAVVGRLARVHGVAVDVLGTAALAHAVDGLQKLGRHLHGAVRVQNRLHAARHDVGELDAVEVAVAVVVGGQLTYVVLAKLQGVLVLAELDLRIVVQLVVGEVVLAVVVHVL